MVLRHPNVPATATFGSRAPYPTRPHSAEKALQSQANQAMFTRHAPR